jgi:hypothetical protein
VHGKEGQALTYLNSNSTHPPHVFRVITTAVLTRLASLTTSDGDNKLKSMKELYPVHCKAIKYANLSPKDNVPPSLDYMKKCIQVTKSAKKEAKAS